MPNAVIREYTSKDRERVRQISLATALQGRPAHLFFDGDDVLADALTIYFTDYEPESCLVAEVDGEVVGYVLSARNTHHMDEVFSSSILWPLFRKAMRQRIFLRAKNWRLFCRVAGVALSGGYFIPNLYAEYPATLHINVLDQYRALGLGEKLILRCLDYLANVNVPGVRLATMSDKAGVFFEKYGFRLFYASKRPYFYDVLNKDVPFKIYCKRLE